jgi:hypothetical protein
VINEIRSCGIDISHTDKLFKELAIRVKYIIEQISQKNSSLVESMEKMVIQDGNLTVFWENRLLQYERQGVII